MFFSCIFFLPAGIARFYLDNVTVGDELGLKTFGAVGEHFQGVSRKPGAFNQQDGQVHDEPEAAAAVKVLEVGGEGSQAGECRVRQSLAAGQ